MDNIGMRIEKRQLTGIKVIIIIIIENFPRI